MTRRVRRATDTSMQPALPLGTGAVGAPHVSDAPAASEPARGEDPAAWLASAFAERVAAWAATSGAPASAMTLVREAARALSLATASGHACLHLHDIALPGLTTAALRDALLASKVTAKAGAASSVDAHAADACAAPLVLDSDDRLYLHRHYAYEQRIARRLACAPTRILDSAARQGARRELARLFPPGAAERGNEADWQKLAVALAVLDNVVIISGGPGTGKTTTVVNLLACLIALDPLTRIALAAPTGKAAARMQDAVRERAAGLAPEVQQRLPQESFTIHRLLGVLPDGTFRHDANNPLALDVLVVDEASMLDLALAAKLFDAVPGSARIVLLGDKDQLAAVESGAVFSELSASAGLGAARVEELASLCAVDPKRIVPPRSDIATPLHDRVVWFTRNFRFAVDSGIGRLATDIRTGNAEGAAESLTAADPAITWCDDNGSAIAPDSLARLRTGYGPYLDALRHPPPAIPALAGLFDAFDRFRILCAEREGPRGVRELNAVIGRDCRRAVEERWPSSPRSPWYCGRAVMVTRNDYVLKLFNGDVGIALPDDDGALRVYFRDSERGFRAVAPMRLPEHDSAFASTVHKAQGSEFDEVALVLPSRASRVLTRELVYTAVTRARHRVTLVCGAEPLAAAIRTPTVRHSGLTARLAEAAARASPG